jgi:hypothetical protein
LGSVGQLLDKVKYLSNRSFENAGAYGGGHHFPPNSFPLDPASVSSLAIRVLTVLHKMLHSRPLVNGHSEPEHD